MQQDNYDGKDITENFPNHNININNSFNIRTRISNYSLQETIVSECLSIEKYQCPAMLTKAKIIRYSNNKLLKFW